VDLALERATFLPIYGEISNDDMHYSCTQIPSEFDFKYEYSLSDWPPVELYEDDGTNETQNGIRC
jgi:hypothetical protein